ncbi:sulfotransferase family protein [Altererythrobacter lutimaris]|uniref:Sulfotransferase n=1 Tax=Altererythrobacter lutimaris TaxID=2743979 RepID=A0A850HA65_9SPHN|nr:sulfotransferase [Altererythrobacter lutimaris]NVE93338.1 sulfotransferase [Altererythrobacter lutimaris]
MAVSPPPVFIVGAPRSGTTLLAAMFGAHPDYAAGPETQFFSKLNGEMLEAATNAGTWPDKAVSTLASLTLADQSVLELFGTDAEKVRAFLSQREPSVAAMLEALTMPFAKARGKNGWVEKTPNHICNLAQIRELWPEARIIRIVRDPRDSVVSTCKLPTFSNSPLANAYIWREWQDAGEPILATDPLVATIRYEDLMAAPETELNTLCAKLGIAFDPAMLRFQDAAEDVSSDGESWKAQVSDKLDASRVYAWKNTLDEDMAAGISLICHEWLQHFGYEGGAAPLRTVPAFGLSPSFVEQFEPFLLRDASYQVRWLEAGDVADAHHVFDHPRYYRFRSPAKLARLALGRRFAKRQLKKTARWLAVKKREEAMANSINYREQG